MDSFNYCLHFPPTYVMTERSTQEMGCKIAAWQEAYELVKQTEHLFNREFASLIQKSCLVVFQVIQKFYCNNLKNFLF